MGSANSPKGDNYMSVVKLIKDVSTGEKWYVSEEFANFLKEHFTELLDGKSFVVCFAGQLKEVFISRELKIQLRNPKEEK